MNEIPNNHQGCIKLCNSWEYLPHFNWWVFRISEPHTPLPPFLTEPEKNPLTPPGTGGNWDDMTNAAGDGSWDAPAGDDWSAPAAQPILGMKGKMDAWKREESTNFF